LRIPIPGDFWIRKNKLTEGGTKSPARKSPAGQAGEEGCLGAWAQERGGYLPRKAREKFVKVQDKRLV